MKSSIHVEYKKLSVVHLSDSRCFNIFVSIVTDVNYLILRIEPGIPQIVYEHKLSKINLSM